MPDRCCQDYSRTELLRRAAAGAAGRVALADPRMPVPAGTGLDRRSFLLRSAGVALSVYGASRLGLSAFEEGIAKAAAGRKRAGAGARTTCRHSRRCNATCSAGPSSRCGRVGWSRT